MLSYIFAVFAPLAMAFFGALQLAQALTDDTVTLSTKIILILVVSSLLYNVYLLTTLSLC